LNRGNGPEFHSEMILDQILLAARKNKPFWTPAKAGNRSDDFLRKYQILLKNIFKLRK
jgi:hypothetical protein